MNMHVVLHIDHFSELSVGVIKCMITSIKLPLVQCYHIFSNSIHVYLDKNHYENCSPQLVPTDLPGWLSKGSFEGSSRGFTVPCLETPTYRNISPLWSCFPLHKSRMETWRNHTSKYTPIFIYYLPRCYLLWRRAVLNDRYIPCLWQTHCFFSGFQPRKI